MGEKPNYYSIIPANVRYDAKLMPNEKLLYGEITSLASAKGVCWAGNAYFSKLYGVTKETVSRWISNLEKNGYIQVKLVRENKQIVRREIMIANFFETQGVLTKKSIPYKQKNQYPIDEKIKENNTSINNTRDNIAAAHKSTEEPRNFKEIVNYLNEKTGKNFSYKTSKTRKLIEARYNEGFSTKDFKKVIDIKCDEWLESKKMSKYLRPQTLFSNKFDEYLNQGVAIPNKENPLTDNWERELDSL